jgi:hypothetical protein
MNKIKIIISSIIVIIFISQYTNAQSNAFFEWKYLELTNVQNDANLAADNYRNSELIADSLIFNQDENYPNCHFFIELSRSYAINNENGLQAFSLLRQHCLYPNDSLAAIAIDNFVEACLKMQIEKEKAVKIFKDANRASNYKSFSDKLNLLIESSIQLYDEQTEAILLRYLDFYQSLGRKPSFAVSQWAFLSKIKLGENKKQLAIEANKDKQFSNIWQVEDLKLQKRVIMRAEHFYAKNNAKGEARYYLSEYKNLDLNFFNKFQMAWRKMLLPIR